MNKIFYQFLIYIFKNKLKNSFGDSVDVIVRNGVRYDYALFPFSDIDLTIIFSERQYSKKLSDFLLKFSKICPYFQEYNVYFIGKLDKYQSIINECELRRDPFLGDHLNPLGSDSQKLVFFYRTIKSNIDKGVLNSSRSKKWNFYLSCMGFEYLVFNNKEYVDYVSDYFKSHTTSINSLKRGLKHPCVDLVDWLVTYFERALPISECVLVLQELNFFEQEVVLEQINWEVIGLFSQLIFKKNDKSIHEHFNNLEQLLEGLDKLDTQKISKTKDSISNIHIDINELCLL